MDHQNTSNGGGSCSDGTLKRKDPPDSNTSNENPSKYKVLTRNRYEILSDTTEEDTDDEHTVSKHVNKTPIQQQPKSKSEKPQPITLHDKHEHKALINLINQVKPGAYNLKYTKDNVNIYSTTNEGRNSIIELLKTNQINFHTYTGKNERTVSYVIRGLTAQTDPNEIIEELTNSHEIGITKCLKMRSNAENPLYMVVMTKNIRLDELTKIKVIDRTRITWERYKTTRRITQCHRCQMWGHATANCHATPKCLKCAENHNTYECQKSKDTPAKCVNCGGNHPANATICPSFTRRRKWLDERAVNRAPNHQEERRHREQQTKPRTFAPAPAQNPWGNKNTNRDEVNVNPAKTAAADDFLELGRQMHELNKLINIKEIIQQIKSLNILLQKVSTKSERIQVAVQFFANIDA